MFKLVQSWRYKRRLRSRWITERLEAVKSLRDLRSRHAVRPLISALTDEDQEVRYVAADALGELGDRRAVLPLIDMLRREVPGRIRMAAARSLGQLGDVRAIGPLVASLKKTEYSDESYAFSSALDALGWSPSTADAAVLAVARHEWAKCVSLGPAAFEPLAKAFREFPFSDPEVQRGVVGALAAMDDPRAVDLFILELTSHKEDSNPRDRAPRREACGAALTKVVRTTANRMSTSQLRAVAALPPICTWYYREASEWDSCGNPSGYKQCQYGADTSEARQLARQELIRRGKQRE